MIIYLLRHGQCTSNVNWRIQSVDDPLTRVWHQQIKTRANKINMSFKEPFDMIIASDAKRCTQTAQIIKNTCKQGVWKIYTTKLLREIDRWILSGKRRNPWRKEIIQKTNDNYTIRIVWWESIMDVWSRVWKMKYKRERLPADAHIIAVVHSWWLKFFLSMIQHKDIDYAMKQPIIWNGEIVKVSYHHHTRKIEEHVQ